MLPSCQSCRIIARRYFVARCSRRQLWNMPYPAVRSALVCVCCNALSALHHALRPAPHRHHRSPCLCSGRLHTGCGVQVAIMRWGWWLGTHRPAYDLRRLHGTVRTCSLLTGALESSATLCPRLHEHCETRVLMHALRAFHTVCAAMPTASHVDPTGLRQADELCVDSTHRRESWRWPRLGRSGRHGSAR